jgi:hypothetical protein
MFGRGRRLAAAGVAGLLTCLSLQACVATTVAGAAVGLAGATVLTAAKVGGAAVGTTAKVGLGAARLTANAVGVGKPKPKKKKLAN